MAYIWRNLSDRLLQPQKYPTNDTKYDPLLDEKDNEGRPSCSRDRSGSPSPSTSSSLSSLSTPLKIVIVATISLVVFALWTALVVWYVARNPRVMLRYSGVRRLEDKFPIVPTDFQQDDQFVHSDPYETPFWNFEDGKNMSDSTDDNAWNFYGNAYVWLHKDDPYSLPGGRPLIPLDPVKDAWMKDYTGFITAYQHEMHCLGAIKHVLLALKEGRIFDSGIEEHVHGHNDHCIEVIRHALSCHPDLSLEVEWFSEEGEHTPFWGGMRHMCRDRDMLHNFLRERNLGFKQVEENGELVTKAWAWGLPGKKFA